MDKTTLINIRTRHLPTFIYERNIFKAYGRRNSKHLHNNCQGQCKKMKLVILFQSSIRL